MSGLSWLEIWCLFYLSVVELLLPLLKQKIKSRVNKTLAATVYFFLYVQP